MKNLLLCLLFSLTLIACGGGGGSSSSSGSGGGSTPDPDPVDDRLPMVGFATNTTHSMECGHLVEYFSEYNSYTGTYETYYVTPFRWARLKVDSNDGYEANIYFSKMIWSPAYGQINETYNQTYNLYQYYYNYGFQSYTLSNYDAMSLGFPSCTNAGFFDYFTYFNNGVFNFDIEYKGTSLANGASGSFHRYDIIGSGQRAYFEDLVIRSGMFNHLTWYNYSTVTFNLAMQNDKVYLMMIIDGYRYINPNWPLYLDN